MIDWKAIDGADIAPDNVDVMFTGYNYNNPTAGRWVISGQRYGGIYESLEGEHLMPTHWAPINWPED